MKTPLLDSPNGMADVGIYLGYFKTTYSFVEIEFLFCTFSALWVFEFYIVEYSEICLVKVERITIIPENTLF